MAPNTFARRVLAPCILLSTALAHADPQAAIADCRAKYAEQPSEHIACLERELQALGGPTKPSLGSDQLKTNRPKETVEPVSVEIQNVSYGFDGLALFQLTDGQVWKATESTPREQRLESGRTYKGRIERGKLGGYRMYLEGVPRMIKVMRVN